MKTSIRKMFDEFSRMTFFYPKCSWSIARTSRFWGKFKGRPWKRWPFIDLSWIPGHLAQLKWTSEKGGVVCLRLCLRLWKSSTFSHGSISIVLSPIGSMGRVLVYLPTWKPININHAWIGIYTVRPVGIHGSDVCWSPVQAWGCVWYTTTGADHEIFATCVLGSP